MFSSDNVSMWFIPAKDEGIVVSSTLCIGPLCRCLLSLVQLFVYNISNPARAGVHWLFNNVPYVNFTALSPTGTPSSTGIPSSTGTSNPAGTPSPTATSSPTGTSTTSQSTIIVSHSDQAWKIAIACIFSVLGGIVLLVCLVRVIRRHTRPEILPAVGPN